MTRVCFVCNRLFLDAAEFSSQLNTNMAASASSDDAAQTILAEQIEKLETMRSLMTALVAEPTVDAGSVQSETARALVRIEEIKSATAVARVLIEDIEELQRKRQIAQLKKRVEAMRNEVDSSSPEVRQSVVSATNAASALLKLIE